jgi:hypothetical protein
MNTEITTTPEPSQELIAKRREAWAGLGETIARKELGLQIQVQNQLQKKQMPTNIQEVVAAEQWIKEAKQAKKSIMGQRMEFTKPLSDKISQLKTIEDSLDPHINEVALACISIKTENEEIEKAKTAKAEELKNIRLLIQNAVADNDQKHRGKIADQVSKAFEYALKSEEITPDNISDFIEKCSKKLGVTDFHSEVPTFQVTYLDLNEVQLLIDDVWRNNPHAYVTMYQKELNAKFSDFTVAFNNKVEALELSKKEAERKAKELQEQAELSKAAASIEAASVDLVTTPAEIKELKKSFEVVIEETELFAKTVDAQFWANISLTRSKIRAAWSKVTIEQKAKALAAVKNDDNKFEVQGIVFKQVSKL